MDKTHPNYLFCILTIFVAASLLFLLGFFPIAHSGSENYYNSTTLHLFDNRLSTPAPKHDQVILMLIDAWRTDFVNSSNMPYTAANACHKLNIKVDTPTVTMPRLKSITTGTVSNFIDIVLNLGHTGELKDSVLHRLKARGKNIVFAGDRTWTELFRNIFLRENANMDSFFVNDFYEGDINITANVKKELNHNDWNLMILHYLGLDHIGHVEGSHSHKIYSKLHEMDDVIKYITNSASFKNKVLLVTGDHGMRNGGSHGGSDKEEIYVPLMLFSNKCSKAVNITDGFNQIDMTPSLSALLGVDIPLSSVGCLITDFLNDYTKEEQLYYYYYNALHLVEKFRRKYSLSQIQAQGFTDYYFWLTEAELEHKHFLASNGTSGFAYEKAKQNYIRVAKNISKLLSDSLIKYDNDLIFIALTLTTLTALHLLLNVLFETPTSQKTSQLSSNRVFLCICLGLAFNCFGHFFGIIDTSRHFIYSILLTVPITLSIYLANDILKLICQLLLPITYQRKSQLKLTIPWILLSFFLFHTFSLASSSLIEEEHQTWYYLTPTMLIFLTMQNFYNNVKKLWNENDVIGVFTSQVWNMRYVACFMFAIVGCRRLNQTGDKWRHLEDIGDILTREQNYFYLLGLFITALLLLLWLLRKYNTSLQMISCFLALLCVFFYRETKVNHSFILFIFWCNVIATALMRYREIFCKTKNYGYEPKSNLVELLRTNLTCFLLVSALLHKPHNVILLSSLVFTLEKSYQLCDNLYLKDKRAYNRSYVLVLKTVISIFIANMYYFFQGNSNSLSTIDLNPGYIGLSSYNPLIVGSFITLNTYSAPINTFLYLTCHMFSTQKTSLPMRQEKEQFSNAQLLESTEEDLHTVISLFTVTTIMPVAVYWFLLVGFRHHLFIYSVFAPKAFYECFHILVFYINFIITNLYFRLFE